MFTVLLRNLCRPNRALSPETHDGASRLGTAPPRSRPTARWRAVLGTAAGVGALSLLAWLLQTRASDVVADSAKSDKGFSYLSDRVASVPWSVHLAKIDRREPTLEIHSTLAKGTVLGL